MRCVIALVAVLIAGCATELPRAGVMPALPLPGARDVVLVGAGDIARCGRPLANARATAALIGQLPEATVFTAGDNAYPDGRKEDFANCYDPAWGAFKDRTLAVPGNHEYRTPGAKPHFEYFNARPWSSVDLKEWHIVLLDSMEDMREGSPQVRWLEEDLRSTNARCIAAIWHHPRYSSGPHGLSRTDPGRRTETLWKVLAARAATLILNGHDHHYERFAPRQGIRQFVIGTGGANLRRTVRVASGSEVRDSEHHGVLVLILHPDSYEWRFVSVDGVVRDSSPAPQACTQLVR